MELSELNELIASVLDVEAETLNDDSGRLTLEVWDSMAHLNIIAAVEETYEVMFSTAEMRELTTIRALRAMLAQRNQAV